MSQRKRKPETEGSNPESPQEVSPDGVLVAIEGGKLQVQSLGQTRPLEVPTLLRKAAKDVERELGID